MLENFHFMQPLWLLALIPLCWLAWRVVRPGAGDNPWQRVVDPRLLPLLMSDRAQAMSQTTLWLIAAGWVIAALALADPTWERKSQPVFQTTAARVVVLDLSDAMNATDLKPSRLARARYKVEDVLNLSAEGQTALVVYAGDAFTVAPLTRDVNTIRAQLKVLDPDLMPVDGGRADLGLLKARELLRQVGATNGQVLLMTSGIEPDEVAATERAAARLGSDGYRVSVFGIGSQEGAPSIDSQGKLLRDAAGKIMVSRLDLVPLQSVARAGGGQYRSISDSGDALRDLLNDDDDRRAQRSMQTDATAQAWKEQGPLLVVLLLPLAALAFRRNWLLSVALLAVLVSPPRPAMAGTWDDLWQRPDQQAAKALGAGDYAKAATLATDADRRGSAEYKRGNYQAALDNFAHASGVDANYNRGNALVRLGQYQQAIAAYDKALQQNPHDEDARANKAAVQALLKQQPPQQQQASNSQGDASQKQQNQGKEDGKNSSQGNAQSQASQKINPDRSNASSAQSAQSGHSAQYNEPPGNAGKAGSIGREDKQGQGQQAASGKGEKSGEPAASDAAQPEKSGNQFADAAKKLTAQSAEAKADAHASTQQMTGGNATDRAAVGANAKQGPAGTIEGAQPLDSEEQIAAEQWLRRIPDDPGGLLRRKFLYQYRQHAQHADAEAQ